MHSSITLVDWPSAAQPVWFDGSKREMYGIIGLADQILATQVGCADREGCFCGRAREPPTDKPNPPRSTMPINKAHHVA